MKRKCAIILIATLVMQLLFCDFGVYKKTVKAAALTLHNPTMINGIVCILETIGRTTQMEMD